MFVEEAEWIRGQLDRLQARALSPLLNVGSGSLEFRERRQPYIAALWRSFESKGGRVIHADLRAEPGVDLVGDLADPAVQSRLRAAAPRAVLASNLLEHVHDVAGMAATLARLVPAGGHLIVTGPLVFQYHPDPIDNGLRITPAEAAALFPGLDVVAQDVIACPAYRVEERARLRAMGLRRRLVRPLYWAKQAVVSGEARRYLWSRARIRGRVPSAYGVVLRKAAA